MRRSLLALLAFAILPNSAVAAPVTVLARDGHASIRNDPFLGGPALTPVPATRSGPAVARAAASSGGAGTGEAHHSPARQRRKRARPQPTVRTELTRLLHRHQIAPADFTRDNASFNAALAAEKKLHGTRRAELTAVTETLHQIAVSKAFVPSRLPALFQTLDRNRQWWTTGPLLSSGERVEFAGSQLVWEYYPGQGIQLQVLGSFGKADGLYTEGPAGYPQMEQLLSELIPLATQRAGGLAWEYYFTFDGGSPPWASAMSQATGLEALTRAYEATGNRYYLQVAAQALPLFTRRPPQGVAIPTAAGTRYLQYTFAPGTSIINAFLQTLIGLHDFATVSGNAEAGQLFAAGNAEALAELPGFDTGAWSLYQPGIEDDLSYHQLVTGFLQQLCTLTATPLYCTTVDSFKADLTTPPVLQQLTLRGRTKRPVQLRFRLSKYSHVGVTVSQGQSTLLSTSASFPYGVSRFTTPAVRRPGTYSVLLSATDLAGNFTRSTGTLQISR